LLPMLLFGFKAVFPLAGVQRIGNLSDARSETAFIFAGIIYRMLPTALCLR